MSYPPNDIAVSVRGLNKSYTIAHQAQKHSTFAEATLDRMRHPFRREERETFQALKDVSFDIKKGEVVGIIGRNGAGKSTLLKVLSRITEPTSGEIDLHGRVGSLLEVGTGFHPELTGRENIFLNGAILGMSRAEIRKQFDAIVDFSGVEKFLDTPVKRYSSGMYVRLAFAVAAHLNPEILIIDEVLAVGDAEFQKKCLGKIKDVASGGRTVLFVSHNVAAVENLCTRAILLHQGAVLEEGETASVLARYQTSVMASVLKDDLALRRDRTGSGMARLTGAHLEDDDGNVIDSVRSGQTFTIVLGYQLEREFEGKSTDVGISLGKGDQDLLCVLYASYTGALFTSMPSTGEFRCRIERLPLAPATYRLGARVVVDGIEADWPRDGVSDLVVEDGDFFETGAKGYGQGAPLLLRGEWCANSELMEARA